LPLRKPLSLPHPAPHSLDPQPSTGEPKSLPELTPEPTPEPTPELTLVLELEDTGALRQRGVAVAPSPVSGYNPYDTGPASGKRPAQEPNAPSGKRTDLRKLSEWIKAQRRVEGLKKNDDEDPK
jgi:hypothetical protein